MAGTTAAGVAAAAEPPVVVGVRLPADARVAVDGRLDEAGWALAIPATGFVQREPDEGRPATEQTEVRFLFDDSSLYVGARLSSRDPGSIRAPVSRRDDTAEADTLTVDLDTFLDRRTAYSFTVTAAGGRTDGYYSLDEEWAFEARLDLVWEAATSRDSGGWTAEIRIPLTQLRFPAGATAWGLNLRRSIPARHEEDLWAPVGKEQNGWASRFGTLTGLSGLRAGRRRELLPYVAADGLAAAARDPADPFHEAVDLGARVGADFKLGVGSGLTLEGTVNPDFGQVEADPAEVNLTAFETFFGEKRPFFLEGAETLQNLYGPALFYSRRIGAAPRGIAPGEFVDYPRATSILGAAKLTGRVGARTSLGALAAVTGRETARVADRGGPASELVVAPATFYAVTRAQRAFGSHQSTAGLMATAVHRQLEPGHPQADLLTRNALTLAAEWLLRFDGGAWMLSGTAAASRVDGETGAITRLQRSSARYYQGPESARFDPARRSLTGSAAEVALERTAGRHWLGFVSLAWISPGFEANDLGQLSQADQWRTWSNLRYRETQPGAWLRSWQVGLNNLNTWTFRGDLQTSSLSVPVSATLKNFWQAYLGAGVNFPAQDFRATRGGPSMATPLRLFVNVSLAGPAASPWRWQVALAGTRYDDGGHVESVSVDLSARPAPWLQLSLEPQLEWRLSKYQYFATRDGGPAATGGGRYIFGAIDQVTLSTPLRATVAFTPDLTLEAWLEPFVASGAYQDFGELATPRTRDLLRYGTQGTTIAREDGRVTVVDGSSSFTFADPDFSLRSFRANVVLRWEYRPGSTLFVVWQQNRSADVVPPERVGPGDLVESVHAPGDNVLAFKISFWVPLR